MYQLQYNLLFKIDPTMQMLSNMNKKLDLGWKMTNISCPGCDGTTLTEPKQQITQLYCPKENKDYQYLAAQQAEQQEQSSKQDKENQDNQGYYEDVYQSYKPKTQAHSQISQNTANQKDGLFEIDQECSKLLQNTNNVSKKIGEKLMQGWTMLNESCSKCMAPIMKSKKGEKICFGCNTDFSKATIVQKISPKAQISKDQIKVSPQIDNPKAKYTKEATNKNIFTKIEQSALAFLQKKLNRSIQQNDLREVQRVIELVFKIKHQFK